MQAGYVILSWLGPGGWFEQMPGLDRWRLAYVVFASIGGLAVHTLLLFYAARRASEVARAFVGILLLLRFFTFGRFLWAGHDPTSATGILMLLALSLHALATVFLCRGDANMWFAGRWNRVDPLIFG